jgi:hypothetical protein
MGLLEKAGRSRDVFLANYNPYHDKRGRFSTTEGAHVVSIGNPHASAKVKKDLAAGRSIGDQPKAVALTGEARVRDVEKRLGALHGQIKEKDKVVAEAKKQVDAAAKASGDMRDSQYVRGQEVKAAYKQTAEYKANPIAGDILIQNRWDKLGTLLPEGHPARVAWDKATALQIKEYAKCQEAIKEYKGKLEERSSLNKIAYDIIAHPNAGDPIKIRFGGASSRLGPSAQGKAQAASDFYGKVLNKERASFVQGSNQATVVSHQDVQNGRAFCEKGKITVSKASSKSTYIHEFGHHIEDQMPGAKEKAQDFLRQRTKGGSVQSMNTVTKSKAYRDDELTLADKFISKYTGKVYRDGSTEVVSMGFQHLFEDPIGFARKDPEHFRMIMRIADGTY